MTILLAIIIFISGLTIGVIAGFVLAVAIGNKIRRDEQREIEDLVSGAMREIDDERKSR
jgi:uncharacterized protein YneF (UPF0154 family)